MHYKRLLFVFTILVIFIAYSLAMVIAEANPVIKKFFYPKGFEVESVKKEYVIVEKEVEKEVYWWQFYATGYSPDDPKQGTNRTMASGKEVYEGAIAVDPDVIPLGTRVEIIGLPNGWNGVYCAEDTGGAIKDLHIDVFRESKFEALRINQMVWIRILEEN